MSDWNHSGGVIDLGEGRYAQPFIELDATGNPLKTDLDAIEAVRIDGPVIALGRLYRVPPFEIPGIAAADALDANDAFGSVFALAVPKAGAIVQAVFHDVDAEGINKELWLFLSDPTTRMAASDAAFSVNDLDNHALAGRPITFDTWKDASAGKAGTPSVDLPWWYVAPLGVLWCQFKTTGTDNIAAGSMPKLSLLIERYDES